MYGVLPRGFRLNPPRPSPQVVNRPKSKWLAKHGMTVAHELNLLRAASMEIVGRPLSRLITRGFLEWVWETTGQRYCLTYPEERHRLFGQFRQRICAERPEGHVQDFRSR